MGPCSEAIQILLVEHHLYAQNLLIFRPDL